MNQNKNLNQNLNQQASNHHATRDNQHLIRNNLNLIRDQQHPVRNNDQRIQNHPVRQQIVDHPQTFNHNQQHNHHANNHQAQVIPSVIEIQKIPEVFSTDLPAVTIQNHHNHHFHHDDDIITHNSPVIHGHHSNNHPMLVDIKPSQIANVIISHGGSSSMLIYGGANEAHKTGQYFNDPPPYANAEIGIKSVNIVTDISGNVNKNDITVKNHNQGNQVHHQGSHYDVKDNIIVASENTIVPSPSPPGVNILIGPETGHFNHEFSQHSVNVAPGHVLHFHPDSHEKRPNVQQQQQQQQQQANIDQQKKQIQIENQKRQEFETQKRQEFENQQRLKQIAQQTRQKEIENQKKAEFEHQKKIEFDNQKRAEFEHMKKIEFENQKRAEFEHQKKIEFENQKKAEFENQRKIEFENKKRQEFENQKKIEFENQKRLEFENQKRLEFEHSKRVQEQKQKQQFDIQQKAQHDAKLRQQFEYQQKLQHDMKVKQQHQENQLKLQQNRDSQIKLQQQFQFGQKVELPLTQSQFIQDSQYIQHGSGESSFVVVPGSYSLHKQNNGAHNDNAAQLGSFTQQQVPVLSQGSNQHLQHAQTKPDNQYKSTDTENDSDNETDSDGQVVQESINHPKLPSGQNHEIGDEKEIVEYDNFVYHKIETSTNNPTTLASARQTTLRAPEVITFRPTVSYTTTRNLFTLNQSPVFITTSKPMTYPNLQFDNLSKLVNELQHKPPTVRPPTKFQRPIYGNQFKPQPTSNTLSPSMQPPPPPRNKLIYNSNSNKNVYKISMPINPMPDDGNSINNLQTEEPFDPRYTQDGHSTQASFTTQSTKDSSTTLKVQTTTTTTERSTTTTTEKTKSTTEKRIDLNIGEIDVKNKTRVDDNLDIFDSKETSHPLNHGYVKQGEDEEVLGLLPPSIRKPYQTIVRKPETSTFKSSGIKLEISSSELETMKPPPPAVKPQASIVPQFEEIINMKAPPLTPKKNVIDNPRQKSQYVNIQRPVVPVKPVTQPPTVGTTKSRTTATTLKPPYRNRFPTTPAAAAVNDMEAYMNFVNSASNLTSDVFIVGSVSEYEDTPKKSIQSTPTLSSSITTTSRIISTPSSSSIESSASKKRPDLITKINFGTKSNEERKFPVNRTKSSLERDNLFKVSTKYITNTKTITLARTKTEVINRSHGVPITTTRVQTSTIFETITETETLLKPTLITSIHPTATFGSFSIQTTASYPTTTENIVEGIVHDDFDLDEFIINYEENESTIKKVNSKEDNRNHHNHPVENESIFVVMTDKKKNGIVNLDSSILNPSLYDQNDDNDTFINEIIDVSRDEEDPDENAGHILLGGILIASPPHLDKSKLSAVINQCLPECLSSKNEVCHRVDGLMRCVCRPGFARMFLDRPCKRKLRIILISNTIR